MRFARPTLRAAGLLLGGLIALQVLIWPISSQGSLLFLFWSAPEDSLLAYLRWGVAALTAASLITCGLSRSHTHLIRARIALLPGALWALIDALALLWTAATSQLLTLNGLAWLPDSLLFGTLLACVARFAEHQPKVPLRLRHGLLALAIFPLSVWLHIQAVGGTEHHIEADVAVVFGAGLQDDGSASDVLRDRVLTGVRLYNDGQVSSLLMTGAAHPGIPSEPRVMQALAIENGVPAEDITLDERGFTTARSLVELKAMPEIRTKRLLMVSNDHHLARIQLGCHRMALDCYTIPAAMQRVPRYETWYQLRETVGLVYYALVFL